MNIFQLSKNLIKVKSSKMFNAFQAQKLANWKDNFQFQLRSIPLRKKKIKNENTQSCSYGNLIILDISKLWRSWRRDAQSTKRIYGFDQ